MVLLEALATLPPRQRAVVVLRYWEDHSLEDAAALLGCSVGTVKSRVNRARKKLEELLSFEEEDDFGPDRMTRAALQATT